MGVGNPMFYSRNKKTFHRIYHISIWLLVLISCIPAMAANAIGLNAQGTCWFTGDYAWCAWGFIVFFIFFAFGAILYLLRAMVKEQAQLQTVHKRYTDIYMPNTHRRPQLQCCIRLSS